MTRQPDPAPWTQFQNDMLKKRLAIMAAGGLKPVVRDGVLAARVRRGGVVQFTAEGQGAGSRRAWVVCRPTLPPVARYGHYDR